MNTLAEKNAVVAFADGRFDVRLGNGVAFSFPIAGNRRLERATPEQLVRVEVDEDGLHWPEIDEDLSFAGLLRGDWGQYVRSGVDEAMMLSEGEAPTYQTVERSNGQTVERSNGETDFARKGAEGDAR